MQFWFHFFVVFFCCCCCFVFVFVFVFLNNPISSSICKLPIRSEIYNCTFKNTNKVSIIILTIIYHYIVFFFVWWRLAGLSWSSSGSAIHRPNPRLRSYQPSESNGYTNLQFERETTTEEDDDPHDVQYRVRNTAISRKVDGKSASDNPERHCGWFWVRCSSEKFERIGTKGHGNMFASAKGKQQK